MIRKPSFSTGKIIAIDKLKGRISVFLNNGMVSTCSYFGNMNDLRSGMSVLIGKVNNVNVVLNKMSNEPGTSMSVSLPKTRSSYFEFPSGYVYGAGVNRYGCLGISDQINLPIYTQIPFYEKCNWAATTGSQSYIITTSGKMYSCGGNGYGELGIGETCYFIPPSYNEPYYKTSTFTQVPGDDWYMIVPTGQYIVNNHIWALKKDGSLWVVGCDGGGWFGPFVTHNNTATTGALNVFTKVDDGPWRTIIRYRFLAKDSSISGCYDVYELTYYQTLTYQGTYTQKEYMEIIMGTTMNCFPEEYTWYERGQELGWENFSFIGGSKRDSYGKSVGSLWCEDNGLVLLASGNSWVFTDGFVERDEFLEGDGFNLGCGLALKL
jgi:hypothetical protein